MGTMKVPLLEMLIHLATFVLAWTLVQGNVQISGVRFLVSVNATDPEDFQNGCIATVVTPRMTPGLALNKSQVIQVGNCDHGPLQFNITSPGSGGNAYTLSLVYHSTTIEDADPPQCSISWNGTYLVPGSPVKYQPNLLPSCFTQDSREGWHLTYYWFQLLDWL